MKATMMSALTALATADSLSIDNLHSSAIDHYTEVICLTDDRNTSETNHETPQSPANNAAPPIDRLTLRFLALSHRSASHSALNHHRAAYTDVSEALTLIDTNRYDFQRPGRAGGGKFQLRYEQVAAAHDRAARSLLALSDKDESKFNEEAIRGHWDTALTLAAMGENEVLADKYRGCLDSLSSAAGSGSDHSDGDPVKVEEDLNEAKTPAVKESKVTSKSSALVSPPPAVKPSASDSVSKSALAAASSNATQTPKYQYYQDNNWMKIQILEPNLDSSNCTVSITPDTISVTVVKNNNTYIVISGTLYDSVVVDRCRTMYKGEKVLIKLKKVQDGDWHTLLDDKKKKKTAEPTPQTTNNDTSNQENKSTPNNNEPKQIPRPYASTKDWNAIDRSLRQAEEAEKPEGEEALNALFKQIYANANEDTRRAMVKSMQTSGGTVLSTNWDEVKSADYEKERVAPKGMEWKNYEGDKLKMKEDD